MGKVVGITEFKAKCIALLDEMERSGEPLTITRRGKPSLTLRARAAGDVPLKPVLGMLKSDRYRYDADPSEPAGNPDDREALR